MQDYAQNLEIKNLPSPMDRFEKVEIQRRVVRPNCLAIKSLFISVMFVMLTLFLNEVDVLNVEKTTLRIAAVISLLTVIFPYFCAAKHEWERKKCSKYMIMACLLCFAGTIYITMFPWASMIILFPMLIATQYGDFKFYLGTVAGSFLIIICAPMLSFFDGTWEAVFPTLMSLVVFSYIGFTLCKKSLIELQNYISVMKNSEIDGLTGVFNRMCFEKSRHYYQALAHKSLTLIYMDANGLHELNNVSGHAAGDQMLIRCAKALQSQFGYNAYRIGGDEFLAVTWDEDYEMVQKKVREIHRMIGLEGYSASIGIACESRDADILKMMQVAEKNMYEDKVRYYQNSCYERRGRRA